MSSLKSVQLSSVLNYVELKIHGNILSTIIATVNAVIVEDR